MEKEKISNLETTQLECGVCARCIMGSGCEGVFETKHIRIELCKTCTTLTARMLGTMLVFAQR